MAALDLASSSFVASATGSSLSYDVFINFRGEDLRKDFIGFLYNIMIDKGINAFLDSEKLWTGEAIGPALHEAIRGSKISIPVFSKGYADSKWCLQELAQIVQCHISNNQIILPIFFFVDPSDVRNQTGTFEKAFLKHKKKFEHQTVESWREALRVVGNLKGEVLDDTKTQVEVVRSVVKRVLKELVDSTCLHEGEYHIDMGSRVKDLSSLLNIGFNDVQFVGICGSGGIGKTTLAKVVYNYILSTFNNCCFLSDIRERATQFGGLVSLQKQFLKDIFKENFEVKDLHRGKGLIKERISKKKVFLVLDDVDSKEQIEALAGNLNWFGKGSRVIITTRDEHVLNLAKVNGGKIYKPRLLDHMHSLQLFSWHAFKNSQPPEDYLQLSHDVVRHSEGLPLILEVFGSYMSDLSDKDEWECALKTLKEIPHGEVQRRLRISYDNLENDYQRDIFLDAACFFIGWKKEIVTSIWEACGFHPKLAISILIKRSLLKFDGKCLIMHDHIRDMGREIVLEKSRKDPSKRSRLWSYGDIVEVLSRHKETDTIEGISLHHASHPPFDLTMESLELMHNLRFLNVSFQFERSLERSFQPFNLYHKGLVYLKLSDNVSVQFWNVRPPNEHKRFQRLKILNCSECYNLSKSPNFAWFPSLEQLNFKRCTSMNELDESIGQLSQLKRLIMRRCYSFSKLPNSIGDLKTVEKLDLSYTMIEELPDSISRMCSLKELILNHCESLKKLPDAVGLLEKLELLDFRFCVDLVELPRSFERMRHLDRIQWERIFSIELLDNFSMPPNLVELEFNSLPLHESLPSNLSALKTLKRLKIFRCGSLEYLPTLPSCLVELDIEFCFSLVRLPDLSKLKMLRTLVLMYCDKLEEISGLEELESLHELDARGSYGLARIQKGRLSPFNRSLGISCGYSLTANQPIYNNGIILCVVLEISSLTWPECFNIDISASIHQKDKEISCFHSLAVKDLGYGIGPIGRDVIYICHFKGFDWFGVSLHENDAIEILDINGTCCRVKLWDVLNWPYVDDNGVITLHYSLIKDDEAPDPSLSRHLTCWPGLGAEVEGSKSLPNGKQEEERAVDEDEEAAASCPALSLALSDQWSNRHMLELPSLVQETGLNYPSGNTQVVVEEEEEEEMNKLDSFSDVTLRPGKRARLHNDNE